MNEKYVVSLPLAKRMKEIGFPQEDCDAYWCEMKDIKTLNVSWCLVDFRPSLKEGKNAYAAPCVGRIGEELGDIRYEIMDKNDKRLSMYDRFSCRCYLPDDKIIHASANTEADARSLMWIKLREEGLI